MKRKYLNALLALALAFTALSGNFTVYATNEQNTTLDVELTAESSDVSTDDGSVTYESYTYINPLYKDIITEDMLVQSEDGEAYNNESATKYYADASAHYCTTYEEAGKQLLEGMKNRETKQIVVYYSQASYPSSDLWHKVLDCAFAHDPADPAGGDYQKWTYAGCSGGRSTAYSSEKETYLIKLYYTVTYYTNAEQEKWMDENIPTVINSLNLDGKCTYAKIKTIYDYITENVDYDYANLNDSSYLLKYTGYAALHDHTAVCQGYSVLLYRMLLTAGIDCRVITGNAYNGESTGAHAWNIVKIGDLYYNLDSTWDANYLEWGYNYFLLSLANMNEDHFRGDDYKKADFYAAYPSATANYNVAGRDGHDFVGTVTKEPDIGVAGEMTYSCSCGLSSYSEEIPALPEVPATTISVTGGGTNRWVAVTASLPYNTKYSIVERGFVYIKASKLGSKELTVSTRYKVKSVISNFREDGTYSFSFTRSSAKEQYVVRAYVAYKDESGKKVYAYSDPYTVG